MEILPEHIRASLAQYSKHKKCTCLHCGYSGLMGVTREEIKVSNLKATMIYVVIMAPIIFYDFYLEAKGLPILPFWLVVAILIGVLLYQAASKQTYLAGPNCNSEILMK